MKVKLAAPLQEDSILDGEGIRTVIWFQGCTHDCPGCHNPGTHDITKGILRDTEDIKKEMEELKYQQGITFSGGDPFMQVDALIDLADYAHKLNLNTWAYTGYTYEEILANPKLKKALDYIDVLIDGRFVLAEKSLECKFRGSKNQRIIDVKKSLEEGQVVNYYED